ncbi:hypothetical protein B0G77_2199 [Paraburkholderia sp. BL10I2N1]|nr:hypothetical protein B0G77_2199 [Paraburkholderia sp. BL10I2N1]
MANSADLGHATQVHTPASLQALADYLELALDDGESVVVMRHGTTGRRAAIARQQDRNSLAQRTAHLCEPVRHGGAMPSLLRHLALTPVSARGTLNASRCAADVSRGAE